MRTPLLLSILILLSTACRSLGPTYRAVDTRSGKTTDLERMADELSQEDVVFVGEYHDNDVGHELELALIQKLHQRRPDLVVSMEMFERDVQNILDLYLAGAVDEETFLARARPWPNYREHYRPVVEWAKKAGVAVLAANCPRPIAGRVSQEGRWSISGDPWAARRIDAGPGAYHDKFVGLMGDHAAEMGAKVEDFFAAQCTKDDTMAESIAAVLAAGGEHPPLVVHLCGAFHSDESLGTVERLAARVPKAAIGVVTMVDSADRTRELSDKERSLADFVWVVPPME